mgnify:FL=1
MPVATSHDSSAVLDLADIKGRIGSRLRAWSPSARRMRRRTEEVRARGLAYLRAFSDTDVRTQFSRVLIDGQWDNANYWIRFAMLRRAMGLAAARQMGILGRYNRDRVQAAFTAFGISETYDCGEYIANRDAFLGAAQELLADNREPGEIHSWELPAGYPAALLYDGILKRQRRASVNLLDPKLPLMVAELLAAIDNTRRVLDAARPDLIEIGRAHV